MVYTSGQLPWRDGKTLLFKGAVGRELTAEQGFAACQLSTLNAIAQLKHATGDLERVRRIVRLEGSLHIAPGHLDSAPKVLNGASETLLAVFGDRGRHSRMIYTFPEMVLGTACSDRYCGRRWNDGCARCLGRVAAMAARRAGEEHRERPCRHAAGGGKCARAGSGT